MEKVEKAISDSDGDRPWQSYHTVYTNAKAGMEGVDKEKVQRIVYEMSKGSKYFGNEERKEADMKQRIDNMRARRAKLTESDIALYQKIAYKRIVELEATRDLSRIWLHVDMDAFYAAVETLCDPSLKGKPMAVGSLSMISTANYEARKFGVRAAMPGFIARKLCPELIFVPVDFKKYNHYSSLTRKVFQKYDPNFLAASLDEAYIDITDFCSDSGMTGGEVAKELRENVHKETGLTCSAGVAPNRLLAKVCSDINKPNGQFVLPNERMAVMTFISSLPIRKIGGIGKVTENILRHVFGIKTCEDMLQNISLICALFSRTSADFFLSAGLGIGRTDKPQASLRKSMSNERTFASTEDEASLYQKLVDLAENLSADMNKEGLRGRTLTLKLKKSDFEVRTRAVTLPNYICSTEDILNHATKLLKAELPASLRLMGLRISHFSEGSNGVPVDPKQKTLSNFIVNEDSSGKRPRDEAHIGFRVTEDALSMDEDHTFSTDTHGTCESIDLPDAHQMPYFNCSDSRNDKAGTERHLDYQFEALNDIVRGTTNLFDSTSLQFEESGLDQRRILISSTDDELASSLYPKEPIFWLDDCRCSICGIEMPPSFSEERQEHFDFHLAERLQEEESGLIPRIHKLQQSLVQKEERNHNKQRKKQKASPSVGKHIPIDLSFAKTNQNF